MILIGSGLAVINYLVLAYLDVFGPPPPTKPKSDPEERAAVTTSAQRG